MITKKDLDRKKKHGEVGHVIEVSCMKCFNKILTNHYNDGKKDAQKEFLDFLDKLQQKCVIYYDYVEEINDKIEELKKAVKK